MATNETQNNKIARLESELDNMDTLNTMHVDMLCEKDELFAVQQKTIDTLEESIKEKNKKIKEYLNLGLSYEKIVKVIGVGSKSSLYSFVQHRKHLHK